MMNIDELLTAERERYLTFFKDEILNSTLKYNSPDIEILLQMNSEKFKDLPEVFQLNRFDLIYKTIDDKFEVNEYNIETLLNYPEQEFFVGKMRVTICPFFWNGCVLYLNNPPQDWNIYYDWAIKWIDIDDKKLPDENGFQGVIHNVSFPKQLENIWEISIDLGTTTSDAIKELFTLFEEQGVDALTLHSNFS